MPGRILVVDDDEAVRVMLARLLESQGYTANPARDAVEARCLVQKHTFDLLIVDVVMPGESGLSFVEYARNELARVPIILISGYAAEEPAAFVNGQPGVTFVPKPFGADQFIGLVEQALQDASP